MMTASTSLISRCCIRQVGDKANRCCQGLDLGYIIDDSGELSIGGARGVCLPQGLKYDGWDFGFMVVSILSL